MTKPHTTVRFLTLIGIACMGVVTIGAQGPRRGASSSRPYVVAKNAFGQPDLEAVWTNNSITPLQRPAAWAGKTALTDAEVEQLKKASAKLEEGGDALFGDELVIDALEGKQQSASHDTETGNYNASGFPIVTSTTVPRSSSTRRMAAFLPRRLRRRHGVRRWPSSAGSVRPTAPRAAA